MSLEQVVRPVVATDISPVAAPPVGRVVQQKVRPS
jgi:hypothetical protein